MADIINMTDHIAEKKLKPILERGWLREIHVDGQLCYTLTQEGQSIVSAVISLMFLESEAWKRPEYVDLTPYEAGVQWVQEILSEEPFEGSQVMFMAIMGERIHEEFGINTSADAQYLLNISRQYSDYGKNLGPIDES